MSDPDLKDHPLLILYHLRLLHQATKSEDFYKTLHTNWENCIDKQGTNVVFWVLFTDFKYSYFTRFSVSSRDRIF
jgi:hypothetical protein